MTLLPPASRLIPYSFETDSVLLLSYICLPLSYSLSFSGQGPCLWWFILCEAIYLSVNNCVWPSQDTLIGFSHKKESSLKGTLQLKHKTLIGPFSIRLINTYTNQKTEGTKKVSHNQRRFKCFSEPGLWSLHCWQNLPKQIRSDKSVNYYYFGSI